MPPGKSYLLRLSVGGATVLIMKNELEQSYFKICNFDIQNLTYKIRIQYIVHIYLTTLLLFLFIIIIIIINIYNYYHYYFNIHLNLFLYHQSYEFILSPMCKFMLFQNKKERKIKYICSVQSKNRYNSRIVLRKVGILTLLHNVGILTLRNTILELLLRKVRIGTKWEFHFISFIYCTKWESEQSWNILYGIVWSLFQIILFLYKTYDNRKFTY